MENQHKLIKGYRDLSQEEIDLMNAIKAKGNEFGELLSQLIANVDVDPRWFEIGQMQLQQGIMAVIRSITKPDSF